MAPKTPTPQFPFLLPGEELAVHQVLEAGDNFGYGNMIYRLKIRWRDMLVQKYGLSIEHASAAAGITEQ